MFGVMLDVGTFWFIFAAVVLMKMTAVFCVDSENAKKIFWGGMISAGAIVLFQVVRLFLATHFLTLGVLGDKTDNLLGSWNALGLFAGFTTIASLFIVEFFEKNKTVKILLGILLVLSLFLIAAVNFAIVWDIVGIFALFIFVYKISLGRSGKEGDRKEKFPILPFAVVMVSLFFFMSGSFLSSALPTRLGVSNLEIRPSLSATTSIIKGTLASNPIIGSGPNRFAEMWAMHKPAVINQTMFWDSSFGFGMGLLPTFAVTTGILGIIAWIIFLVFLIFSGAKLFFSRRNESHKGNALATAFFFGALYLFVAAFVYSTGTAIFLLAFAFTGAFIGLSLAEKPKGILSFTFLDDPRKSFFFILLLVVVMVVSAGIGFKYIERFASVPYFQKTLDATNIADAESNIVKTVSLYSNDLYWRTYSQVYVAKMNSLAAEGASISDADKAALKTSLNEALSGAQSAIAYDPTNYLNYKQLGDVYSTIIPFGVTGASDSATTAYEKASSLNPESPSLKLNLAQVAFSAGNVAQAKTYAEAALTLKPDYVDALVVLSQIAKSQGDTATALAYAQQALSLDPTDQNLIQYVNFLESSSSANTAPSSAKSK